MQRKFAELLLFNHLTRLTHIKKIETYFFYRPG